MANNYQSTEFGLQSKTVVLPCEIDWMLFLWGRKLRIIILFYLTPWWYPWRLECNVLSDSLTRCFFNILCKIVFPCSFWEGSNFHCITGVLLNRGENYYHTECQTFGYSFGNLKSFVWGSWEHAQLSSVISVISDNLAYSSSLSLILASIAEVSLTGIIYDGWIPSAAGS